MIFIIVFLIKWNKMKKIKIKSYNPTLKIKKPKAIVLSGYGLNCEEETKFAFEYAGGKADIIHINELIARPKILFDYDIMAFPGGFSFGDDTGSGKAYANKMRNHLSKELEEFLSRDTLVIGICNGFQILTSLGILPGALTYNKNAKYIDRWVDLKVIGRSPWLTGIKNISLPIAHGEGRYIIDNGKYKKMSAKGRSTSGGKNSNQVAFIYTKGDICKYQNLEKNPNGAMHDIGGVLGYNGRVLGMMPHPERAMFYHHSPLWPQTKASLVRGKQIKKEGVGLQIFKNAINYFKK
ncbi:phosphoribosylformylglycinamidine synthase [Candidatus Nomurabacteria bacterium CG_4_9_14_0_2_um_filter_32_10]|uniref:Phosphoribosylformylglycinamidine synthase n=3 Tax=Candidatus Nomuraibacteriota TaxID=1752729 RepID=A0A2H0CH87_9BACT|nr:MAG: phosphoribosylformylglycinamidine synthase [Candidatus Nomurabacteria bacterium CG22_combo_CG10-13_8_21_14_all_32_8]PIZ86178.1 MAG: phosphoribosylformylglycinamidine synthase [Candidatus Nomurabacteria bacterium CG_4_10_14_0_2_um_filter_33_9]PJC49102.1 MAG: phosphoribosylformylglycinamidine synthase [Candidatus Nomurabacteria bacterium CG_4_9_14_0_2_um_filter_32_10]